MHVLVFDADLLGHPEIDAGIDLTERLDLGGGARSLAAEIVSEHAQHHQPLGLVPLPQRSRSAYCGVKPHFDAVFTTITGLPANSFSGKGLPVRLEPSKSKAVVPLLTMACPPRKSCQPEPNL
jgi:hypothetical protein